MGGIRGRPRRVVLPPNTQASYQLGPQSGFADCRELQEPPGKCGCGEQSSTEGATVIKEGAVLTAPVRTLPTSPLKCVIKLNRDRGGALNSLPKGSETHRRVTGGRGTRDVAGVAMGQDSLKMTAQCCPVCKALSISSFSYNIPATWTFILSSDLPRAPACWSQAGRISAGPGAMQKMGWGGQEGHGADRPPLDAIKGNSPHNQGAREHTRGTQETGKPQGPHLTGDITVIQGDRVLLKAGGA